MTRTVTLTAAVVAIAAAFAAPAGAATFEPLTERTARPIALKLARGVARERDVRWWLLSDAVKVRRTRVTFQYLERLTADQFCKARVVIEQSSRVRRAFLAGSACRGIPEEALSMERAGAALIRSAQGQAGEVRASLRAYARDIRGCQGFVMPRGVHDEFELLLEGAEVVPVIDPLFAHLDAFVTALQDIQPEDPQLVSGIVAWRRLLTIAEALPSVLERPCTAMREWAAQGYSAEAAPVDFEALSDALASFRRQQRGIARTALRMAELGLSPRVVAAFEPVGIAALIVGE